MIQYDASKWLLWLHVLVASCVQPLFFQVREVRFRDIPPSQGLSATLSPSIFHLEFYPSCIFLISHLPPPLVTYYSIVVYPDDSNSIVTLRLTPWVAGGIVWPTLSLPRVRNNIIKRSHIGCIVTSAGYNVLHLELYSAITNRGRRSHILPVSLMIIVRICSIATIYLCPHLCPLLIVVARFYMFRVAAWGPPGQSALWYSRWNLSF